jgi:hypothetical protein
MAILLDCDWAIPTTDRYRRRAIISSSIMCYPYHEYS